jgi:hypothetical protein
MMEAIELEIEALEERMRSKRGSRCSKPVAG